jgi:branched-chain amino acid transport system permease protein
MLFTATNSVINGIFLGGLYGLFAAGLSLAFGVMRLVNVAHGDFIVLAAFLTLALQKLLGLYSPFVAMLAVAPLMFILGYVLQRYILNPTLGGNILRPVLVTFGISIVLQNGLLEVFTADSRKLQGGWLEVSGFTLPGGFHIGIFPLAMLLACLAVISALQWFMSQTKLGRAFRATSDDKMAAALMGVDTGRLFSTATGITMVTVSIASVFMGIRATFDPSSGNEQLLFAFEAVIIGGLGSLWGTLAGGMTLGISQSLGAMISPSWQILAGHLVFLAILVVWPSGLFPKRLDD